MKNVNIFNKLQQVIQRPKAFEYYTTPELWQDEYLSKQMLEFHLDQTTELASRNLDFIKTSVNWFVSKFNLNNNSKVCDFGCGPGLYTTELARL